MFERRVVHRYQDPVDMIWLRAAADLGLTVVRTAEAYAAYDGKGTLAIAQDSDFDADDCLAQMIFHEICHWLVAGRRGFHLPDWGLSNLDDRDLLQEQATHRLQAALAAPHGLRDFLAVTTDWRPYWDGLPEDPLRDGEDPAIAIAQTASVLARSEPFEEVLQRSLSATAAIADAVREVAPAASLWHTSRPRHRLGSLLSAVKGQQCGTCAWAIHRRTGAAETGRLACRQHKPPGKPAPAVVAEETACERWEPAFDAEECGRCGACCHRGFDVVGLSRRDPFRKLHPELVQLREGEWVVPRPDGRCLALEGDGESAPYRCRHYEARPRNCADFEVAGDACLLARRRVGLSR